MKVLSVQSVTAQGSVAIYDDETEYTRSIDIPLTGRLSTALAPAINDLLEESGWDYTDIDLYACAAGPGSFTGLRVGMAVGKGLSLSVGCAIKIVPTLDIIRYNYIGEKERIIAVIDARSERIYYAEYSEPLDSACLTITEPKLASVKELLEVAKGADLLIGPDSEFLGSIVVGSNIRVEEVAPDALTMAVIARGRFSAFGGDEPGSVTPIYLKSGQV